MTDDGDAADGADGGEAAERAAGSGAIDARRETTGRAAVDAAAEPDVDDAAAASSVEATGVEAAGEAGASGDSPVEGEEPKVRPEQGEMPFALVLGEPYVELPKDLYIPPDALEVFLETFEGPLDLLLYLIRRQNLDILDIPIAQVTAQYVEYVDLMSDMRLELAAEYLVMAAMLAEIKARMLMPRQPVEGDEEESDPRAELVRRLQEYERYKLTAEAIEEMPRVGRDLWPVTVAAPNVEAAQAVPEVSMADLLHALHDVLVRADHFTHHRIETEPLSVRERMATILGRLNADSFVDFSALFTAEEGRRGVVVTLIAILELVREQLVELSQMRVFGPIRVKGVA